PRSRRTRAAPCLPSPTIPGPFHLPTACCASRTASSSARSAEPRASRRCTSLHATESVKPMPKGDSSLNMLIVAAILALGVGYYVPQTFSSKPAIDSVKSADAVKADNASKPKAAPKSGWATSAAGRVEPTGGEVRIGTQAPGRVAEVLVSLNDKVVAGDLLARVDDEELIGRANAALAEATVRKRERDSTETSSGKLAQDRRSAEDAVANAERQLVQSREDFDRAYKARRGGQDGDVEKARDAVNKSKERLEQARVSLRKALAAD